MPSDHHTATTVEIEVWHHHCVMHSNRVGEMEGITSSEVSDGWVARLGLYLLGNRFFEPPIVSAVVNSEFCLGEILDRKRYLPIVMKGNNYKTRLNLLCKCLPVGR